jgi:hypothetical protein
MRDVRERCRGRRRPTLSTHFPTVGMVLQAVQMQSFHGGHVRNFAIVEGVQVAFSRIRKTWAAADGITPSCFTSPISQKATPDHIRVDFTFTLTHVNRLSFKRVASHFGRVLIITWLESEDLLAADGDPIAVLSSHVGYHHEYSM